MDILRWSKNVRTAGHSYFGSSLIQLWDLSIAGFCGLIKYSEKQISFRTLVFILLLFQQMMIGGGEVMTILGERQSGARGKKQKAC